MLCPTVKLYTGAIVPMIGLGTYRSPQNETKQAVITAIKNGYRHIDTALVYGNEIQVGEAIKECVPSICKREDLFITTKLWGTDFDPEDVESALKVSLKRLDLPYVDLYLIHWPVKQVLKCPKRDPNDYLNWLQPIDAPHDTIPYSTDWFYPCWAAMEKCYKKGLAKAIGICNISPKRVDALLKVCEVKPAMLQIELHPGLTQEDVLEFCFKNDIQVTAFCPLGRPDRPDLNDPNGFAAIKDPVITSIAQKYNRTPAQIMLRWGLQRNTIVIPKSTNEKRIIENFNILDFKIENDDMININKLNKDFRISPGLFFIPDPEIVRQMWEK